MFKQTSTELTKLSNEKVKEWLNSFDTVLTDCDGKLNDFMPCFHVDLFAIEILF